MSTNHDYVEFAMPAAEVSAEMEFIFEREDGEKVVCDAVLVGYLPDTDGRVFRLTLPSGEVCYVPGLMTTDEVKPNSQRHKKLMAQVRRELERWMVRNGVEDGVQERTLSRDIH